MHVQKVALAIGLVLLAAGLARLGVPAAAQAANISRFNPASSHIASRKAARSALIVRLPWPRHLTWLLVPFPMIMEPSSFCKTCGGQWLASGFRPLMVR